ncbi:MAG: NDP-sugar synthase, partial [Deltaproteobacteria bacterium]|nr:NDP-sugar synthase [Nannocystaceae bacterium]
MVIPRAMILAAGYGTRLGELGRARPKPMLPVVGVPLVRWAVLWLRHHGIREIAINLHHLGEQIEAELGDGAALDVAIAYSREHGQILGTGGGLRQARRLIDDGHGTPVVVMNAKLLVDLDLHAVIERHLATGAEATMVVRDDPEAERWGSLRTDAAGDVTHLLGKPGPKGQEGGPALMFTGVQVLAPRFLDRIPPSGQQCVVRTAYSQLHAEGGAFAGFVTDEYWWEHSTVERYLQGVANVIEGRAKVAYAPGPVRGVDPSAVIEAGAEVDVHAWVGPGATIGVGAKIGPRVQL